MAITIHMLTLYDKNIAANMDDIDDNDRTMTWTNFFWLRPTDTPKHTRIHRRRRCYDTDRIERGEHTQ